MNKNTEKPNNSEELLSVIVPVYNVEEFLKECIDSIRVQTYSNIEIILVDDGSSDTCPQICDKYSALDSRIKTIHKSNGGLSSARNAGLDAMNGKYVTFIDSDDIIIGKNVLKELMEYLNSDPNLDIVQYDVIHKYNSPEAGTRTYPFKKYSSKEEILNGYLSMDIHVSCCDKIFKSTIFKSIRFPEKQISEDIAIIPEIVRNAKSLRTTDIGYYGYRYREGSISNSALPLKKIISILRSYFNFHNYAFSFDELKSKVIEAHSNLIWSYTATARRSHPKDLPELYTLPYYIKLSLTQWFKLTRKFNGKDRFKSFVVCVMGPKWITRFQKILTHD